MVAAVRSLYADGLEPFGRILLRRVRERCVGASAGSTAEEAPLVDPKSLLRICRTCSVLRVEPVDGNEVSVLLIDTPASFVDVCSPWDPYPHQLWCAATAYFESLCKEEVLLPGGRYACAQALASRKLPFLASFCLGEICHIVQLAVSHKKILGYVEGNMVPYCRSEEYVKEQCAASQQPFSCPFKQDPSAYVVATWEEARACISAILRHPSSAEPGVVTISNVKRLFRSRFGLDLSETALGHSRLSELLQDPRFHDVCRLKLQTGGQFVVCQPPSEATGMQLADLPARQPQVTIGRGVSWPSKPQPSWEVPGKLPSTQLGEPCSGIGRKRVPRTLAGHKEPQCLSTAPLLLCRSRVPPPDVIAFDAFPGTVLDPPHPSDHAPGLTALGETLHCPPAFKATAAAAPQAAMSSSGRIPHRDYAVQGLPHAKISPPPGLELERSAATVPQLWTGSFELKGTEGAEGQSLGELLSAHVRRLLELSEKERGAALLELSGRVGAIPAPATADAAPGASEPSRGRGRSSSGSTSVGSERTWDLDSTLDSESSRFGSDADRKERSTWLLRTQPPRSQ